MDSIEDLKAKLIDLVDQKNKALLDKATALSDIRLFRSKLAPNFHMPFKADGDYDIFQNVLWQRPDHEVVPANSIYTIYNFSSNYTYGGGLQPMTYPTTNLFYTTHILVKSLLEQLDSSINRYKSLTGKIDSLDTQIKDTEKELVRIAATPETVTQRNQRQKDERQSEIDLTNSKSAAENTKRIIYIAALIVFIIIFLIIIFKFLL